MTSCAEYRSSRLKTVVASGITQADLDCSDEVWCSLKPADIGDSTQIPSLQYFPPASLMRAKFGCVSAFNRRVEGYQGAASEIFCVLTKVP